MDRVGKVIVIIFSTLRVSHEPYFVFLKHPLFRLYNINPFKEIFGLYNPKHVEENSKAISEII